MKSRALAQVAGVEGAFVLPAATEVGDVKGTDIARVVLGVGAASYRQRRRKDGRVRVG